MGGVGEGVGGCHFFITLQFNYIYCMCGKSKVYSSITFTACVGKVKFTVHLHLLRVWEK